MKIIPKTQKDFEWVNYKEKQIKDVIKRQVIKLREDLNLVKTIPKKERSFDNTILAIEEAGLPEIETNTIALLSYISPSESVRKISAKMILDLSKQQLEIMHDEDLYRAFSEYKPVGLDEDQSRLYKDMKRSFENMGFQLPKEGQKDLNKIKNDLNKLEQDSSLEINNSRATILCTLKELDGMDNSFIEKLPKDKKTGKYIVSTDYPDFKPFAKNATNHKKRKELIDKDSKRVSVKNIKRLQKILELRDKKANILGYKSHAEYVLEDRIVKNPKTVLDFLNKNLEQLKSKYLEVMGMAESIKKDKVSYFDNIYFLNEYLKNNFSVNENEIKKYFELGNITESVFKLFGNLFNVSFEVNKTIKLWHPDVFIFDIIDSGNKIAHLAFDLYPRKGKYGHACHWTMSHGSYSKELNGYNAPVSVIISNYSKPAKNKPTLLTFWDVEAFYHEFGHALHSLLTKARYGSQAGTSVSHDFVETPSQLFEMWLNDDKYLQSISSHYKTKEALSMDVISRIQNARKITSIEQNYRTFVLSLFDIELHLNPKDDILKLRDKILKNSSYKNISENGLWPASFGHIYGGYDVGYYGYMWALVYSYDIFSKFKEEGITSKKVGMDLRRKILEKGDAEDPIKIMTDFLGRKPNNKAFLKALGIK